MTQIPNNDEQPDTHKIITSNNTEQHRFVETDRRSERLAKLKLGLRLLRKVKANQGKAQNNAPSIEPLYTESPIEDYIQAISKLGDQAAHDVHYTDLQDACLLIEDALRELTPHEFAVANAYLLSIFNEWSQPLLTKSEVIIAKETASIDNEPITLNSVSEQEAELLPAVEKFDETLEKLALGLHLLQAVNKAQASGVFIAPLQPESSIETIIQAVKTLTEYAAHNEQYAGLQDACFLLEDALSELSQDDFAITKTELLATLNDWVLLSSSKSEVTNSLDDVVIDDVPPTDQESEWSPVAAKTYLFSMFNEESQLPQSVESDEIVTDTNNIIDNEPITLINTGEQETELELLPAVTESADDVLEKLVLGLHLLQAVNVAPNDGIFTEPLQSESSIETIIHAVKTLAEQATHHKQYADVQDACFLLEDALCELSQDDFAIAKAELLATLNAWVSLSSPEPEISITTENEPITLTSASEQEAALLPAVAESADDILEKLVLGLHLLQAVNVTPNDGIFTEPLQSESSIETIIHAVKTLAEQATHHEQYADVQDACFLLEDALCELSQDDFAIAKVELLATLNAWVSLSSPEPEISITTENEPITLTSASEQEAELLPDVEEPTNDDVLEKLVLGLHLLQAVNVTPNDGIFTEPLPPESSIETIIHAVKTLAEQATHHEQYADVQDACFLLEDALFELSQDDFAIAKAELLATLNAWVSLSSPEPEISITTENELITLASANEQEAELLPDVEEPTTNDDVLEKLVLGLHLLQAVNVTPNDGIFTEPLQSESSIETLIHAVKTLAEQATHHEQYADVQDACFLLEDALCELSQDDFAIAKAELLATLNAWVSLRSPEPEISIFTPDNVEIDDNVLSDTSSQHLDTSASLFTNYIATIENLANQAEGAGYSGLHGISLLLVDALHDLSQRATGTVKTDFLTLLDNWCNACDAYRQNSLDAIDEIITILRHPDLNIQLDEDDFATFTTLLVEEIGTNSEASTQPSVISSCDDLVILTTTVVEEKEEDDGVAASPLSAMAQELVELLDTEAGLLNYRFLAISFDEPITARAEHLQQASEELDRLANASTMVGFEGLSEICKHINANISHYSQQVDSFTIDKRDLLLDWVSQVKAYLLAFNKKGAGKQLLAQMSDPNWILPLTADTSSTLLPKMQVNSLNDDSAEQENNRQTVATDEDVVLTLPDDVNKELLDLLLQELPAYTQQFSEAIQHLQSGNGSSKDIDVAQRIAHTIKGSANTVGIKGIAFLTHQIEDILMACAKAHKQPNAALMDTLINASDCLEAMCESLLGQGEAPQDAREVLQEVLDWANQIAKNGIEAIDILQDVPVKQTSTAANTATIDQRPDIQPAQTPKETTTEKEESAQVAMVRVPTDQIENLFKLSSESIILNGQIYERQRRLKNQLQTMEAQFALLQQLGAELEQLIDLKDLSGRSLVNTGKDFDALEMDQYNELHTASRRMVEAAVDAREISVDMKKELEYMNEVLEYQQRLVINTQEAVMQTRFVPVGSIVLRLQRGLRQTCRLTGKQAELTLLGENLLIDGDTLNALIEPLMHLLRNAIDHGLETEEERIMLGKPVVGQIFIEFDREGNSILVRCRDDGRGLDFGAIRHTAEQRGDLKAGDTITEDELKRLILRANFSTRTQLTQTSGRGVGMDVVNFQVVSLGGSISLNSVLGQGLTVELRIPLPLSRSHALIANAGPYKVAISSKGLTQILYSTADDIKTIGHERVLVIGEDIYPAVKLEDLLHIHDRRKGERFHGAILLVQNEGKITAVEVDSITDSREVVIKSLGYYMRKIHGFVGATILGDGSVTPVLDIPELLRAPVYTGESSHHSTTDRAEPSASIQKILIVDDSLSQRRALEQILTDAGFHVHAARDGIEAVEWLTHSKPLVVITDLEMPRMNGIELASHIRTQASIKTLPIIMITSRSTQKHRQMAEEMGIDFYLVKPVQDDNLLTKIQLLINKQHSVAEA